MAIHEWNGHRIEVKSYAVPKMLWFGVAFSVAIDESERFSSPHQIEGLRTVVPFKVTDNGSLFEGRVESGRPCSVLYAAYRVIIGNEEVATGSVIASNWYATYAIIASVFAIAVWLS
jgi:hypothetical protein